MNAQQDNLVPVTSRDMLTMEEGGAVSLFIVEC